MESSDKISFWRILLVEDHPDTRRALEQWLIRRGHSVFPAGCMVEALHIMEQRSDIQILLSDIGLPDGNGWELLGKLSARKNPPPPPAIAMSGYGSVDDRVRSRAAGFAAHLVKPFRLSQLTEAMENLHVGESPVLRS